MTWYRAIPKVASALDQTSFQVIFEDEDLLAVNKPPGMLVEGGDEGRPTLEDWAAEHFGKRSRPLHRLDRATSGVVLIARNAKWNAAWNALFERKRIRKEYWAIVAGNWPREVNRVEAPIEALGGGRFRCGANGKPSKTTFRVMGRSATHTWIEALPKTGRTHQIRLHCREAGCPVVGDRFYAPGSGEALMLHGRRVRFAHPNGSGDLDIAAEPPAFWGEWLSRFDDHSRD